MRLITLCIHLDPLKKPLRVYIFHCLNNFILTKRATGIDFLQGRA